MRDCARPGSRTTLRAKSTTSTVRDLRLIDVLLDTHTRPLDAAARQFLSRRAAVDITLRLVDESLGTKRGVGASDVQAVAVSDKPRESKRDVQPRRATRRKKKEDNLH